MCKLKAVIKHQIVNREVARSIPVATISKLWQFYLPNTVCLFLLDVTQKSGYAMEIKKHVLKMCNMQWTR